MTGPSFVNFSTVEYIAVGSCILFLSFNFGTKAGLSLKTLFVDVLTLPVKFVGKTRGKELQKC